MDERSDLQSDDILEEFETYIQSFGTTQDVVVRYTHCALCGANLHFTHVTDFSRNVTQETARCPECGVRPRKLIHRLQ